MEQELCSVVLGLDFGTSHVKAVVFGKTLESNGEKAEYHVIGKGCSSALGVDSPAGIPGGCELSPHCWISAMKDAIDSALKQGDGTNWSNLIAAIGVSGQQHGLVVVDQNGDIIRPCMLWCDTRAEKEAKEISAFGGNHVPAGFTAPKILWLKRNEPEKYQLANKFMLPHDYINFYLSGKSLWVMEPSDASGTGLFDVINKSFDSRLVEFIDPGLQQKLPAIHTSADTPIGWMASNIVAELFPCRTSVDPIMISCGGGDNAMSALGVGANVVEGREPSLSSLIMSLGTSGTLFGSSCTPVIDPDGTVAPFCDCTGNYLPLLCVQNCAAVPEEFRRTSGLCEQSALSLDEVTELATLEPVGSDNIIVLPYFSSGGERTPSWPHASGTIVGLKHGHLRRHGLLYRAALESVTMSLYRGYLHMQQCGMPKPAGIELVGGGAKNQLWKQIIADVFQLPVTAVYGGSETGLSASVAALGAAFQAMAVLEKENVALFAQTQRFHLEEKIGTNEKTLPSADTQELYTSVLERRFRIEDAMNAIEKWA